MNFLEIFAGAILAICFLLVFRQTSIVKFKSFFSKTLILAAAIYVGFILFGLIRGTGSINWLVLELVGFAFFSVFALYGQKKSILDLGIGWLLHIGWDVGLHSSADASFVPTFYPAVCLGFDLVFGVYLLYNFFVGFKE